MTLPKPLLAFDSAADPLAVRHNEIDVLLRRDTSDPSHHSSPNTAEAHRIEYTYHSNAIEGSTLTLRETQLIIEGMSLPGGKSMREVYEARNHDRAVRRIESWLESEQGPAHPLDERALLELHGLVLADIMPSEAGAYRSGRVRIAGSRHIPPGPHRFEELMPAALGRLNNDALHPVLRAAELHYNLVAVHPFSDGNGRTARLMMNAWLLQNGYPLCIIEVERRAEYLSALDAANTGNPLPFAGFIAGCVERSLLDVLGDEGPDES
ncbi:MAG: Fic family protein [Planctomycetota bacterium]